MTFREMIQDPRAFPCLILFLYACSSVRWAFAKNWGQALYWLFAFGITFTVTFMMKKGNP